MRGITLILILPPDADSTTLLVLAGRSMCSAVLLIMNALAKYTACQRLQEDCSHQDVEVTLLDHALHMLASCHFGGQPLLLVKARKVLAATDNMCCCCIPSLLS